MRLRRSTRPVPEVIERLVGLQAQRVIRGTWACGPESRPSGRSEGAKLLAFVAGDKVARDVRFAAPH